MPGAARPWGFESPSGHHLLMVKWFCRMSKIFDRVLRMKCKHGCGLDAVVGGRCQKSSNSCPSVKERISEGARNRWKTRGSHYQNIPEDVRKRMAWSKGKSKETDPRIEKQAVLIRGRRKISDPEKLKKREYWESCQFSLGSEIDRVLGYELLPKFGMFDKKKNRGGVVRDHRFSIENAYREGVDSKWVRHPANCRFLMFKDNARKTFRSEISFEQLVSEIQEWERSKSK